MKKEDFKINEFVAIYTDSDLDSFGLGYVLGVNDEFLLIQSVDPQAELDGVTLYDIEDIVLIERNTNYCKKIERLMKLKDIKPKEYFLNQNDYVSMLLDKSKKERGLINVQLLGNVKCVVFGVVKEFSNETCTITQIDSYGIEDGECQFAIRDISSIKFGCREDEEIARLAKQINS